ncbi:hypothetical protein L9F63_026603, partial [Diploptera punctata]
SPLTSESIETIIQKDKNGNDTEGLNPLFKVLCQYMLCQIHHSMLLHFHYHRLMRTLLWQFCRIKHFCYRFSCLMPN